MFLTLNANGLIERVLGSKDQGFAQAVTSIRQGCVYAIEAKERECALYRREIDDLRKRLLREQARADAAIDRLLMRDARVCPLGPTPESQEATTSKEQDAKIAAVKDLFDQVASVGEDEGAEDLTTKDVFAGAN